MDVADEMHEELQRLEAFGAKRDVHEMPRRSFRSSRADMVWPVGHIVVGDMNRHGGVGAIEQLIDRLQRPWREMQFGNAPDDLVSLRSPSLSGQCRGDEGEYGQQWAFQDFPLKRRQCRLSGVRFRGGNFTAQFTQRKDVFLETLYFVANVFQLEHGANADPEFENIKRLCDEIVSACGDAFFQAISRAERC